MQVFKNKFCLSVMLLIGTSGYLAHAAVEKTQPDNSAVNQRDHAEYSKTADHQMNHRSDVDLTRMVRRELTSDSSLSTYAKNIKIVTRDGTTTLRGPVQTQEEKDKIGAVARKIVGSNQVHNQLEIKQ